MSLIEFEKADLDYDICRRAYYWLSFDPDKAGRREQDCYYRYMQNICEYAETLIISDQQRKKAIEMLEEHKPKVLGKTRAHMHSLSNTASSAITGPSNFNHDRNRKKMYRADNKCRELIEYKEKFKQIITKILNSMKPQESINNKIEKHINSMISEIAEEILASQKPGFHYSMPLLKSNFRGRIETIAKNNPEKIDYITEKIKEVEKANNIIIFTTKNKVWDFFSKLKEQCNAPKIDKESNSSVINGVEVVKNYELDRLQLFFNGKPEQEVISKLKKGAWHWSPSNKCWQRQLTPNAESSAKRILGNK